MTRKGKEKILLDGLGLRVGDKVILFGKSSYKIKEKDDAFYLYREHNHSMLRVDTLLTEEFEKYVEPKKWKEVFCDNLDDCELCPLNHIDCGYGTTLQDCLNNTKLDDEEREFYQKRIDRECKEKGKNEDT